MCRHRQWSNSEWGHEKRKRGLLGICRGGSAFPLQEREAIADVTDTLLPLPSRHHREHCTLSFFQGTKLEEEASSATSASALLQTSQFLFLFLSFRLFHSAKKTLLPPGFLLCVGEKEKQGRGKRRMERKCFW